MKTTTKYLAAIGSFVALIFFMACNKENSVHGNAVIPNGQSKLSVHLMDDPIQFSKVLIDIRQVAVLVDTSTGQTDQDDDHQESGQRKAGLEPPQAVPPTQRRVDRLAWATV